MEQYKEKLLRGMYLYTFFGAGFFGLSIIILPDSFLVILDWLYGSIYLKGLVASTLLAFSVLGILGFFNPSKFLPVLLMQLIYKSIWLIYIILCLLAGKDLTISLVITAFIYLTYIIGDILVIPFKSMFGK